MTNTLNRTYRELSSPYFKEVFRLIDKICSNLRVEYYLIGAQARNIHLLKSGIAPCRGTQDIDFAVMLPEMKVYDEIKDGLEKKGFRKVNEPYRLVHDKTNTVIDLLPFGEIEEEGTVRFTDRETELSVIGMKEVSAHVMKVNLEEITIKVSPLEGMIILKLISFSEKPDRTKDLDDINDILSHYFDINEDRFYEEHADIVDEIETDDFTLLAGSRMLGRDMKRILKQSKKLTNQIEHVIQNELGENIGSITKYFLSQNYVKDYELIKNIFTQLLKGIKE